MKLVIGSACSQSAPPVNTYQLIVTGMSGDSAHDEENSQFGSYDTILMYAELLDAVMAVGWNDRCTDQNCIWPVIKAKAAMHNLDQAHAINWYKDMIGNDLTCEDRYAMLMGYCIYWYDANGQKFEASVEPD